MGDQGMDAGGSDTASEPSEGGEHRDRDIQEALRERFLLFEIVSDGIMVTDLNDRVVEWNPAAERIFGYTREHMLGRSPWLLHPFADVDRLHAEILRAVRVRGAWSGTLETVRRDGRSVYCEVTVLPLRDASGEMIATVGVNRDLSDRRIAAKQMLAQEERFRSLLDNIEDIVAVLDPEGRIRYISPSVQRSLGYPPAQVLAESALRFLHPADRRELAPSFAEALAEPGAERSWELRARHRDRSWRVLEIHARNLTADPAVRGLIVTGRDVTERRRAESALRANEARFRAIFDQAAVGVTVLDPAGRPILINQGLHRILGYTQDQLVDVSLDELIHPDELIPAWRAFGNLIEGEISILERDLRLIRRDGRVIWTRVGVSVLDPAGPEPVHAIAIVQDITERREAEIALHEREEQLRQAQKMEAVGRLAGGIAHDFNNMLTVIRSFAELLRMDLEPGSELVDYVAEIQSAADRSVGLTRQLLAFSRRQVLQPEVVNLNEVVSRLQVMLRRLIGEDVTLVTLLEPMLPPLHADPGQLEQVVMNLVVNARDAMPRGGEISIRTRFIVCESPRPVEGGQLPPGAYIRLSIEDTGSGMDPAVQRRIFEPFFTTKEQGQGTGLGLSTVYGIVDQSGGYLEVDSKLGVGTTFHIYLPQTEEAAAEAEDAALNAPRRHGTETVLIVEDEPAVRSLASLILRQAGYDVVEASSGPQALEMAQNRPEPFDLLLSDVVMPEMSGQVLARRLLEAQPDLSIVFMSGYNEEAIARHGVLHEGAGFIEKPFTLDSLLRSIRDALD